MTHKLLGTRRHVLGCCLAALAISCLFALYPLRATALVPCVGDCHGDGRVTVDDLILGVNIVLSARSVEDCEAFDVDGSGRVVVNELVQGVRAALEGCAPTATPATEAPTPTSTAGTPSDTSTPTPSPSPTETLHGSPTPTSTRQPTAARPNVIVLNLDDTRADSLDRMPNLQALAAQSVVFRNSFVSDSVCAPSRASMLSGLYARHHGTRGVALQIGGADTFRVGHADRQTIAVWLQAAGYQTGLFGKYINDYAGSEATAGPGGTYYVPPGWTRWRGMTSPEHYGGVLGRSYTLVDEHGGTTLYDDHTTDDQYSTHVLASELRVFVNDAIDADKPFFALWTPYASHADQPDLQPIPASKYFESLRGIPLWRPPSWAEADLSDKPLWVRSLPMNLLVAAVNDTTRSHAYETLLSVDDELGTLLQLLRDRNVLDNTVVILTSDNGVCWGEHGYYNQGKGCAYEECLRVPLIVSYPRVATVPRNVDEPVLNIDLAPTIAALAGVLPPVLVDGTSFAPFLVGANIANWRDSFLVEYWHELRGDTLTFDGQVTDGDRVRVVYGDTRMQPRSSVTFEFDGGDGTAADNAISVPIGADARSSFMNLGAAIAARLPGTTQGIPPQLPRLGISATNGAARDDRLFIVEVDQGGVMHPGNGVPDWVGLRDTADAYTYVEYETGELELYDLATDPSALENRAGDPAYAEVQGQLSQQLRALLGE